MKQSPRARRWRKRVLATGLWLAGTIAVLVVATACRCEPPSTEQVAPSPLPPSDHWHPERKAPCVQVSNADGEALAECAYALELQDLKLCGKCCPERSGCDPFLKYYEPERECEKACMAREACKTAMHGSKCVHCLACCKSYRCKYGFGEYAGTLLSFKNVQFSLVHPYPVCPIAQLNMPLPPCVPPIDGPACQGMKRATVGLTLADGTFVPLLTGKDEREVRCEGPWSTSREGLPDWAPMFSNERFFGPCYPVSCPAWIWKPQTIVVRAIGRGFLLVVPPPGFKGSVSQ